jgi:hypothetical protein
MHMHVGVSAVCHVDVWYYCTPPSRNRCQHPARWGNGSDGALGHGDFDSRATPMLVSSIDAGGGSDDDIGSGDDDDNDNNDSDDDQQDELLGDTDKVKGAGRGDGIDAEDSAPEFEVQQKQKQRRQQKVAQRREKQQDKEKRRQQEESFLQVACVACGGEVAGSHTVVVSTQGGLWVCA